jgi:hypothetical protein
MQKVTRADEFLDYQIERLVKEQQETNKLLKELLDTLKPPVKEVEKVELITVDKPDKRKRR